LLVYACVLGRVESHTTRLSVIAGLYSLQCKPPSWTLGNCILSAHCSIILLFGLYKGGTQHGKLTPRHTLAESA